MSAKSQAQQRFMGMCAHAAHPPASCPSRTVAREFAHASGGVKNLPERALRDKSTRGSPPLTAAEIAQGYRRIP